MIKKLVGIIICTLLIFTVLPFSAKMAIHGLEINEQSADRGNVLHVGGVGPNNFTSIQIAINAARPGDTVFVHDDSSPYKETVVIDKSINLIGENRDATVIDGQGKRSDIIHVISDNVKIDGFTIKSSYDFCSGIKLNESNFVTISGSLISDNFWGVELENSHFNIIVDNIIQENEYLGIMSYRTANHNIITHNNIIFNGGNGIGLGLSVGNQVLNNHISYNNRGLSFFGCRNNNVKGNTISSNDEYGLFFYNGGRQNKIVKNNFMNNGEDVYFQIEHVWENNKYFRNYWGEPLVRPKIIYGKISDFITEPGLHWINIDWFPAREPYDLGGV